jgi:hypothetical protein
MCSYISYVNNLINDSSCLTINNYSIVNNNFDWIYYIATNGDILDYCNNLILNYITDIL